MTEEIIIDGVNVAECKYVLNNKIKRKQHCPAKAMPYAKETSCVCRKSIDTPYNFCKHNPNCHYKQLKRLEQREKALTEIADNLQKRNHDLTLINARLEQENKEMKKQIESDKGLITVGGKQQYQYLQRVEELEQENKELKTKLDVFAFTISQYESALEEIKNSVINYLPKENYKFDR